MVYQIGRWYIEYNDGVIGPCYNWATAKYLVDNGYAVRMFNPTEELLKV
jgi:hypothetical protein